MDSYSNGYVYCTDYVYSSGRNGTDNSCNWNNQHDRSNNRWVYVRCAVFAERCSWYVGVCVRRVCFVYLYSLWLSCSEHGRNDCSGCRSTINSCNYCSEHGCNDCSGCHGTINGCNDCSSSRNWNWNWRLVLIGEV